MRIAYISNSTIPSRTANSIHVMKMCQALAKNGHEVILIAPDKRIDRELDIEDAFSFYGVETCFEIMYLPWLPSRVSVFVYGFLAAQKAKIIHPDLVYGRDLVGCYFASLLGLPVVFESHAPIEIKVYKLIFQALIARSTFKNLIVITHALYSYYSENYPALADRMFVAPDGSEPISKNTTPIILFNRDRRLQVGYVGHLYPGRGIEIIEQLAKRCPWADFHVIGGTKKDIASHKQRMKLGKNLILHGYKTPHEAERYRLACDILLAPYQNNVFTTGSSDTAKWMSPLKLFEYMAAGKAIICSDLPVLREILTDGQNALLCQPEDIDAWEKALVLLGENEGLRSEMGERAKRDLIDNYTWCSRAQRIIDHFLLCEQRA